MYKEVNTVNNDEEKRMEETIDDIKVLDHGYVRFIENWGSDERIIEAARMSTNKGFNGWGPVCEHRDDNGCTFVIDPGTNKHICDEHGVEPKAGDEKLLRYLWENKHTTPFEMAGLVVEVMAPIEVYRQWHRHRTQSYNEMSARYTPLPDMNYVPTTERLMLNSTTNKQAGTAKGSEQLTEENAHKYRRMLMDHYAAQEELYQWALANGIPKEVARTHIGVGRYSRMRASANLLNWLKFLTLRMDPHAQWEIREYAKAVHDILAEKFPRTLSLFDERRMLVT